MHIPQHLWVFSNHLGCVLGFREVEGNSLVLQQSSVARGYGFYHLEEKEEEEEISNFV